MLPCFVMLDLETTGGSALHDRITEIAAVRIDERKLNAAYKVSGSVAGLLSYISSTTTKAKALRQTRLIALVCAIARIA